MKKQTQQTHDTKKSYAKPAMVEQGDFTKTTAGYFVGAYSEWITRRFT
ncbi:keywimysin-related RiPP [Streptomyces kunmingensis]|uniref:Keywimysin-related RiPP n=1 Tax=Streptomyces kunmingensis TaxID=68225 RepID=A0ABU6CNE8_9ACTN|nr:keywimysin-related RiPP [Streptomyces kunmingensis]MEB3966217.1 keywimysin-related RiPP [Streptomyces kunmingensis]